MHDAYAAGLFDGEGCVQIARYWVKNRKTPYMRYQLVVSLQMCHAPTIHALYRGYGGLITRYDNHHKKSQVNRIQYTWRSWSSLAATFLRKIRPYAITKAEQIDVALEFQDHIVEGDPIIRKNLKRGGLAKMPNGPDIYAWRDAKIAEIKRLNNLNFDIPTDVLRNSINCDGPMAAP